MNTTHTQRALVRFAGFALAATLTSFAHAEGGDNRGEMMFADMAKPSWTSDKPRADVKAATRAANVDGGIGNNGQATYRPYYYTKRGPFANSTKTRAESKAETAEAIKNHQMPHAGEFI